MEFSVNEGIRETINRGGKVILIQKKGQVWVYKSRD